MLALFHGVIDRMRSLPVPVVAAVHGAALGGGCELALACDIVLARDDARFGQPEIQLGVFPPAAAALMPRRLGRQHALDLILTGRAVSAAEAREIGLAAHVWPADEFDRRVADYLRQLGALSAPVLRLAKQAVDGGAELDGAQALAYAEELYLEKLMRLHDSHEGLAAFLEKRRPVWKEA
jgi:cyclohexa-1,5-dienecarbonyl-CoA hydratase